MKQVKQGLALLLCFLCCCHNRKPSPRPGDATVVIVRQADGFRLYRKGLPYNIKGVCVLDAAYLRQAKESGANSVRTYGTENAREILDSAQKLGLTVTLGLKLPYAGTQMSYRNKKALALQVEKVRKEVVKYRNHPALLMWGIGNELNLYLKSSAIAEHIALLQAIQKMSEVIHAADPNHPVTTTLPYVRKTMIWAVNDFCSDLDCISINSFQEMEELPAQGKKYSKPYIISEYGANGYWLTKQTAWSTQVEQTSGEKSAFIIGQSSVIRSDTGRCLGAYAFIWGYKLEYTPSWFSIFTEQGEATQVADALQYCWTGKWPSPASPSISSIRINGRLSGENIYVKPGQKLVASITAGCSDARDLYVTGQLQPDDLEVEELYSQAYYNQRKSRDLIPAGTPMTAVLDTVRVNGRSSCRFNIRLDAPAAPGPYRLFLRLHNRHNRVATANACFYVHE